MYHKIEGLKETFLKEKVSSEPRLYRVLKGRHQDDQCYFPLRNQMLRVSITLSSELNIRLRTRKWKHSYVFSHKNMCCFLNQTESRWFSMSVFVNWNGPLGLKEYISWPYMLYLPSWWLRLSRLQFIHPPVTCSQPYGELLPCTVADQLWVFKF